MTKFEAIQVIQEQSTQSPVVTSLGTTSRFFVYASGNKTPGHNQFPVLSSMGSCLSTALGVAVGLKDKLVVAVMGDGEFLMGVGSVLTLARLGIGNLSVLVLNNKQYAQDGGFATAWNKVDLESFVSAIGIPCKTISTVDELTTALKSLVAKHSNPKTQIINVAVSGGGYEEQEATRVRIDPVAAKQNFQKYVHSL